MSDEFRLMDAVFENMRKPDFDLNSIHEELGIPKSTQFYSYEELSKGKLPLPMYIPEDSEKNFYDKDYWINRDSKHDPRFDLERADLVLKMHSKKSDGFSELIGFFIEKSLIANTEYVIGHMSLTRFNWSGLLNFKHNDLGHIFEKYLSDYEGLYDKLATVSYTHLTLPTICSV